MPTAPSERIQVEKSQNLKTLEKLERLALGFWRHIPQHVEYEDHLGEYMTADVVEGFETNDPVETRAGVLLKIALEKAVPLAPGRLQPPYIPYRLRAIPTMAGVSTYSRLSEDAKETAESLYRWLEKRLVAKR